MGIYIILGFFLILGSVFGWVAFFKTQKLSQQIYKLQKELQSLKSIKSLSSTKEQFSTSTVVSSKPITPSPPPVVEPKKTDSIQTPSIAKPSPQNPTPEWINSLKNNWMIWLGGACVSLSGIFLVKYSMDQGMLGPGARIISGIILGLALHISAEWLRRNKTGHPSFAALAAGGSITLFAALLSALHLYQMLNPTFVFILMSLVALATMGLAVLHGPVLAIIGILGAYLVPIMVGDGPGGEAIVLVYSLIISASALLLMRYVYRSWLWIGVIAGGLGWWLLTLDSLMIDGWRGIYLAIFAYLLMAIPNANWRLNADQPGPEKFKNLKQFYLLGSSAEALLPISLFLIIFSQYISIIYIGLESAAIFNWSTLTIILLIAGGNNKTLCFHPWVLLISQLCAWMTIQFSAGKILPLPNELLPGFYWYCLLSALIYSVLSLFNYKYNKGKVLWVSLATLAPLLFLTLAYLLTDHFQVSLQWGLLATLLAGVYLALATKMMKKRNGELVPAWLFIGSHLGYSLAVAMFLKDASMTLALAVQVISLSWVIKKFEFTSLSWLLKGVVALVILRLSLNPWLEQYPTDIHWSLWTYGGATLCCWLGGLQLQKWPALKQWAYAATLHLFALTVWAETRYWIYDGNVYSHQYDFIEAALNLSIFASLGLIYYLKVQVSSTLGKIYALYSKALMLFALFNYAIILLATISSLGWVWTNIGETKIFNLLLLAFGMPVILGYLSYRYYYPQFSKYAALFTAGAGFIFISLQIRHLFQGTIRLSSPTSDTELYTYSAVWLALAVTAILGGVWRYGENCYRAGILLLTLVIAKLFLVDMSDLEGLLRVASFMGMGLGLLAIAYLHQKLNQGET